MNNPALKLSAILLALAVAAPGAVFAGAGGTDTGGTGSGSKYKAAGREGGTDTGGTGGGSQFTMHVSDWCRSNQAILQQYKTQAALANIEGDAASVVDLLLQGLIEARNRKSEADLNGSLTYRAIVRGIDITTALLDLMPIDPEAVDMTRSFLFSYYKLIDYVAQNIDIEIYIPYNYQFRGCKTCDGFDLAKFEARFVDYAKYQIDWFLAEFTTQSGNATYPKLSIISDLVILEHITKYLGEDLRESLDRTKFACAIDLLEMINVQLSAHNLGNRAYYKTDRYALNIVARDIRNLKTELSNSCTR